MIKKRCVSQEAIHLTPIGVRTKVSRSSCAHRALYARDVSLMNGHSAFMGKRLAANGAARHINTPVPKHQIFIPTRRRALINNPHAPAADPRADVQPCRIQSAGYPLRVCLYIPSELRVTLFTSGPRQATSQPDQKQTRGGKGGCEKKRNGKEESRRCSPHREHKGRVSSNQCEIYISPRGSP